VVVGRLYAFLKADAVKYKNKHSNSLFITGCLFI
jgi:hypothetical protein